MTESTWIAQLLRRYRLAHPEVKVYRNHMGPGVAAGRPDFELFQYGTAVVVEVKKFDTATYPSAERVLKALTPAQKVELIACHMALRGHTFVLIKWRAGWALERYQRDADGHETFLFQWQGVGDRDLLTLLEQIHDL